MLFVRAGLSVSARALPLVAAVLTAVVAYSALTADSATSAAIQYQLTPKPATADRDGLTRVRITVDGMAAGTSAVQLRMPVWTPGEYRIQNHGRYVRGFRIAGSAMSPERPDPHTWSVPANGAAPLTVEYELVNAPPGVFTENVDVRSRRAFYNGAATFAFVSGRTREPVGLAVTVPRGWPGPVTTLSATGPASYSAASYDELADSPILLGDSSVETFQAHGKAHSVALFGQRPAQGGLHRSLFEAIARAGRDYMGSLPYDNFTFFVDSGGRAGGLEHANGARIAWSPWMDRSRLARFMAHEYFHLWNVKRIRPAGLGPFDYINPPKTRNLWFCEGVTEYVAGLLCLRAGLLDEQEFLNDLARSATTLANTPARLRVTADEASLHIWDDGNSSGYRGLSVYLKGEMIGLCLDLELLRRTDGRYGLRELMRDLMERYAPPKPGYPEDGLRQAVVSAGGEDMGPYYDRLCRTTRELPIGECLRYAGFTLNGDAVRGYSITRDTDVTANGGRIAAAWLYGR